MSIRIEQGQIWINKQNKQKVIITDYDESIVTFKQNENDQEYQNFKVAFERMYKLDVWGTSDGEISTFEQGNEAHQELQKSRGKFWDEAAQTWEDKFVDYISDMYDLSEGDVYRDDNSDSIVYILKIDVEAQTVFVAETNNSPLLTIIDIYQFTENYTFYPNPAELPAYIVVVLELLTLEKLNTLHDIWNTQPYMVDAVVVNYDSGIWVDNISFPDDPEPLSQFVESYEAFDAGDQWISQNYEVCILKIDTENKLVLFVNIQNMDGIVYDMRDVRIQPIATFEVEYAKTAEDREWLGLRPEQADELVRNWLDTEKFVDKYEELNVGQMWNENDGCNNSDKYIVIVKINSENETVLFYNTEYLNKNDGYVITMMKIVEFKKYFRPTKTVSVPSQYRKLSVGELILLDSFWNGTRITVDLRRAMFGKMFTVEEFRHKTLINDDYALIIKYLDEELDCDIGISVGTRKNPVKIKIKTADAGDDWDRDKDGFLTIFCAKDLKQWLNTNTGSYGLNANTADEYFENQELHDNNPSKPWQTIVGIQYLTQEEIDEEEKKYRGSKENDETDEILKSIIKKKREVGLLKKELTYLRWNYAVSQFEERSEFIKSKMQRITAEIRILKNQIRQQQSILKWASDNGTKLKF